MPKVLIKNSISRQGKRTAFNALVDCDIVKTNPKTAWVQFTDSEGDQRIIKKRLRELKGLS